MIDPKFAVIGSRVEPHAALPTIMLTLAVSEARAVEGMSLSCQVRLEPQRRSYSAAEEARLTDLFGAPPRWASTLRPLPWLETSLLVPPFEGRVEVTLPIVCSYDLEVGAARYFHALEAGDAPVRLLFRGQVFLAGERGLQLTPLPWSCEAGWRLPVRLWREAIDGHFPEAGWLRLKRPTLDALLAFKGRHSLSSWDGVMELLLSEVER